MFLFSFFTTFVNTLEHHSGYLSLCQNVIKRHIIFSTHCCYFWSYDLIIPSEQNAFIDICEHSFIHICRCSKHLHTARFFNSLLTYLRFAKVIDLMLTICILLLLLQQRQAYSHILCERNVRGVLRFHDNGVRSCVDRMDSGR